MVTVRMLLKCSSIRYQATHVYMDLVLYNRNRGDEFFIVIRTHLVNKSCFLYCIFFTRTGFMFPFSQELVFYLVAQWDTLT